MSGEKTKPNVKHSTKTTSNPFKKLNNHAANPLNAKCWSVSFFLFVKGWWLEKNTIECFVE